jgi:dihydrofolate synthase/folylpolyglutamate synthase
MSVDRHEAERAEVPGTPLRTADEAVRYLDGLINRERIPERARGRVGLEPIRRLLAAVGNPERGLSFVHVAGSKGKGSVCLLSEALLRELGERTGTFTSPHLERWTERFRVDGVEVEGAALARAVERLRPHVDRQRAAYPDDPPSVFDATTAAALLVFAEARVDRVLFEVGLGGRLDSTNVVAPAVSCITSIELEHTATLGGTFAKIATEKAGILKPGVTAIVGELPPEATVAVRQRAREVGAPLRVEGEDFDIEWSESGSAGSKVRYAERDGFAVEVALPLLGGHQARNAGLSLACVRALDAHEPGVVAEAATRALANARLPGRVEIASREPWVVIDSAHTAASARALARVLRQLPVAKRHLVLSVSEDKDLAAILASLLPGAQRVTVTRADPHRSLAEAQVAEAVRRAADVANRAEPMDLRVVPNPRQAVRTAREAQQADELLCVTGSIYLAGIARSVLLSSAVGPARRASSPLAPPPVGGGR